MSSGRKHWFRVADSILYEGWSNDELATFVRLCAHLNTRWAREGRSYAEAGISLLDPADILKITGRARLDVGLSSLRALAELTSICVEPQGKLTRISWAKWSEFQHLKPDSGDGDAQKSPSPQDAPARRKTPPQDSGKREPAPRAARASRKSPEVAFPGAMVQRDWDELAGRYGVDPVRLEEVVAGWAGEKDRRYTATGWRRVVDRALRDRWDWTKSLFGRPAAPGALIERESPAQARERRTIEAGRRVLERANVDPFRLALVAGSSVPK